MKEQKLVTRESIETMLNCGDKNHVIKVVGRALLVLFNNQTADERALNTTNKDNGIGFTGADARGGSLTAKFYKKHGTLEDWQLEKWLKPNRLAKYHNQLNEAAKRRRKASNV